MDARTAILARVSEALSRSQHEPAPAPMRNYRTRTDTTPGSAAAVETFVDRLTDYRANVRLCTDAELAGVLGELLGQAGTVVVPPGLEDHWIQAVSAAGTQVRTDTTADPLSHTDLDEVGAVLTAARTAIAETGTIVLDGEPDQGRRAISLVPDHHVCVVRTEQVVVTVPEAVAVLTAHPQRPMTWISGPSATSDIELVRVEGVHGPRTLDVVVVS